VAANVLDRRYAAERPNQRCVADSLRAAAASSGGDRMNSRVLSADRPSARLIRVSTLSA
jgi:hypothetical protein